MNLTGQNNDTIYAPYPLSAMSLIHNGSVVGKLHYNHEKSLHMHLAMYVQEIKVHIYVIVKSLPPVLYGK